MKTTLETQSVINPWFNPQSAYSTPEYDLSKGKLVFSHRGVDVYHWPAGGFLHLIDGMAVTHRSGLDKTGAAIDNLLDGTNHTHCCDTVAIHLRKLGFTPNGY